MSGESLIEWCDRSWEVTAGCTKVSSGCANCYAERLVGTRHAGVARKRKRDGTDNGSAVDLSLEVINDKGRWSGHARLLEMNLSQPLSRKAPTVYFVNSRSDLFHPDVPFSYVDKVFAVMALCPRHRFLVLTKRPERMRAYLEQPASMAFRGVCAALRRMGKQGSTGAWPLENVWLGTSVEDQEAANTRLPELYRCPAAGRFVSAEPLLNRVSLGRWLNACPGSKHVDGLSHGWMFDGDNPSITCDWCGEHRDAISGCVYGESKSEPPKFDWVIVGGESGPGARPCNVEWIRSIKELCEFVSVPVFVKQLGACASDPVNGIAGAMLKVDRDADALVSHRLKSRKGNDMAEWPADLRVRDVPEALRLGVVAT
jgi:protein gp37